MIGPLIQMGVRFFMIWWANRNDPETVKFWDARKLKAAREREGNELEQALIDGDTRSLNGVLSRVQ